MPPKRRINKLKHTPSGRENFLFVHEIMTSLFPNERYWYCVPALLF